MSEENINILENKFREELEKQKYVCTYPIWDYEEYTKQSKREFPLYFLKCCYYCIIDWFKSRNRRL